MVRSGNTTVATVIGDLVTIRPWTLPYLRIYGIAELIERQGQFGTAGCTRMARQRPELPVTSHGQRETR